MGFVSENWDKIQYLIPVFYIVVVCAVSAIFSKNLTKSKSKSTSGEGRLRDRHKITEAQSQKFDIDDKISELSKEAVRLNTPETFVQQSKVTREIIKLRREAKRLSDIIAQEGGVLTEAELEKNRFEDLKKSGSNNKMLVAFGLCLVLSKYGCSFNVNRSNVYPLELFMGGDSQVREIDGKSHYAWDFHLTLFFAFLTVRFSTRLGRLFGLD